MVKREFMSKSITKQITAARLTSGNRTQPTSDPLRNRLELLDPLMKPHPANNLLKIALLLIAMLMLPRTLLADPPIWANARRVKATVTQCEYGQSVVFRADSAKIPAPPAGPGCRSEEVFYTQLNIAQAFLTARDGTFAEANVDAGYISCAGAPPAVGQRGILIIGTPGEIERARRMLPVPPGCNFTRERVQFVASLGGIPFVDVPNGGTMSIPESLALHAREREKAIADCNASPACRAEVQRRSAINTYFECMKPLRPNEPPRTCYRPW